MLSDEHRQLLRDLAYASIKHGLETGKALEIDIKEYPAELQTIRATFVTLHRNEQLRGCIGILKPVRPLAEDVAYNAWAAAFVLAAGPSADTGARGMPQHRIASAKFWIRLRMFHLLELYRRR